MKKESNPGPLGPKPPAPPNPPRLSPAIIKWNHPIARVIVDDLGLGLKHCRKLTLTFEVNKIAKAEAEFQVRDGEGLAEFEKIIKKYTLMEKEEGKV